MQEENALRLINRYRKAIMGFAALWIFIFHTWNPVMEGHWRLYAVEEFVKRIGFCGVEFFLFLSGMGLFYSIKKYDIITFYKRRFMRVFLPMLMMAFVFSFVQEWGIETFFRNLFGISFYFETVFSFLWFGTAILTIYLLFPIYHYFFEKAKNKYIFTGMVLTLWMVLSLLLLDNMRSDFYGVTNRIPVFILGVLAGWMAQEQDVKFTKYAWFFCILETGAGLYLMYLTTYRDYYLLLPASNCCLPTLLVAVFGSFILAKLFALAEAYLKAFGKGILIFLGFFGGISFELYCVQEILDDLIYWVLADEFNNMTINLILLACSIAAAYALKKVCGVVEFAFSFVSTAFQSTSRDKVHNLRK